MFRKETEKSYSSGYLCVKSTNNQPGLLYNITMKQHSTPNRSLLRCQFQKDSETILLSDLKKNLLKLNLNNLHYTSILEQKQFDLNIGYEKDRIYVASSENQSKLYMVNTINKRWQRFNLNINKIIAFEINIQRNLILVADPVIMNIFDERTKAITLTYKPPKEQRILKALFTADNRSVIVLHSNMSIKQLSLHNLEEECLAYLPFEIQNPQIALSGNNRYLVITGSSHQLVLMSGFAQRSPKFTILGFPYKIKSTKFDLNNNLILLGRDQIVYYYSIDENKSVKLFNYLNQDVIHSFDVSLDNKYLCCISNFGTIFIFIFKDIIDLWKQKKQLYQQKQAIILTSYVPEKQQIEQQHQTTSRQDILKQQIRDIPTQSYYYGAVIQQDFPPEAVKNPDLGRLFGALKFKLKNDEFFKENGTEVIQLIYAFHKLIPKDCYNVSHYFLEWIVQSESLIDQLGLVMCPALIPIVQKRFNLNFRDFILKSVTGLFLDYFNQPDWIHLIQSLLRNKSTPQILLVFFFTYLNSILPVIKQSKTIAHFQNALKFTGSVNELKQVFKKAIGLSRNEKYGIVFERLISVRRREEERREEEKEGSQRLSAESSKRRLRELLEKREGIEESIGEIESKKEKLKVI